MWPFKNKTTYSYNFFLIINFKTNVVIKYSTITLHYTPLHSITLEWLGAFSIEASMNNPSKTARETAHEPIERFGRVL
jgi:hypothetical protein